MLKHLEGISDQKIVDINIPTGVPRAYWLNARMLADKAVYLGDPAELEKRIAAVKSQTSRK